jgi:UDP-glucose 4-epimerase
MRVLVAGGAGYIGSVMVRMLAAGGHDVLVVDDLSKGHLQSIDGFELASVDIDDRAAVRDVCMSFRPEACMHFAALSLVGESMAEPLRYFSVNLSGSINLLRGLVEADCRNLVFSSSAAVYGEPDVIPIEEGAPTRPISPYGISKLMFEQVLSHVSRVGGIRFASMRYFNAAGADVEHDLGEDHRPESHLIPRVIAAALGNEPEVSVFGDDYPTPDGTCIRDYIHIIDLCRAHMLALEHLASGGEGGIFNLGSESGFSVREVIDSVRRVSGRDLDVVVAARRPGDPPVLVASSEKIKKVLGWSPGFKNLDEIVDSAWKWHVAHPEGYY